MSAHALQVWYRVGSGGDPDGPLPVSRVALRRALASAGIREIPETRTAAHAFRLATGATHEYRDRLGQPVTLAFSHEEYPNREVIVRRLELIRDLGRHNEITVVARFVFFKAHRLCTGRVPGTEKLEVQMEKCPHADRREVSEFVARVRRSYVAHQQHVTPAALRAVIRGCLAAVHAVPVAGSSGGMYLASPAAARMVGLMQDIVQDVPDCTMQTLELPDSPQLREILRSSVDAHTCSQAAAALKDITDWMSDGRRGSKVPTTQRVKGWMRGAAQLRKDLARQAAWAGGGEYPKAEAALGVLDEQIREMRRVVLGPAAVSR